MRLTWQLNPTQQHKTLIRDCYMYIGLYLFSLDIACIDTGSSYEYTLSKEISQLNNSFECVVSV